MPISVGNITLRQSKTSTLHLSHYHLLYVCTCVHTIFFSNVFTFFFPYFFFYCHDLLAFLYRLAKSVFRMPIHKLLSVIVMTAVLLLSHRVQSQVTFDQPCPKLEVVRDFDLHRVRWINLWFVLASWQIYTQPILSFSIDLFLCTVDKSVTKCVTSCKFFISFFFLLNSSILACGTTLKTIRPSSARSPVALRPTIP